MNGKGYISKEDRQDTGKELYGSQVKNALSDELRMMILKLLEKKTDKEKIKKIIMEKYGLDSKDAEGEIILYSNKYSY